MYLNKRKTEYTRRSAQSTAFVGFSSVPDPVQYLCTLYYNTGKRQRIISLYSYSYRTATARRHLFCCHLLIQEKDRELFLSTTLLLLVLILFLHFLFY